MRGGITNLWAGISTPCLRKRCGCGSFAGKLCCKSIVARSHARRWNQDKDRKLLMEMLRDNHTLCRQRGVRHIFAADRNAIRAWHLFRW